uniref:Uncharacterized protein n=1 Tax=Bracon brevicornis TaxID=1563983 RepID=A0A6V7KD83_9HYME
MQGGTVLNPHAQQVLSHLVEQKTVQTPGDVTSRLDEEMSNILSSRRDPSEKWKLYQDTLRRYLFFSGKKEEEEKPQINTPEQGSYNTDLILSAVPKKYKHQAASLVSHLNTTGGRIRWDPSGVVELDGRRLPGSNIVDLVNDALRHRKTVKASGRTEFARFLQEINTPRGFVGKKSFWTLNSPLPPPADETFLGDNGYYETPLVPRTRPKKLTPKSLLYDDIATPIKKNGRK